MKTRRNYSGYIVALIVWVIVVFATAVPASEFLIKVLP